MLIRYPRINVLFYRWNEVPMQESFLLSFSIIVSQVTLKKKTLTGFDWSCSLLLPISTAHVQRHVWRYRHFSSICVSLLQIWQTQMQALLGLCGKVLVVRELQGWLPLGRCHKLPTYLPEPVPASSKICLLLAKVRTISDHHMVAPLEYRV